MHKNYASTTGGVHMGRSRSTSERGYGIAHQAMRAALVPIVVSGGAVCARCGKRIAPDEPWDLGHSDDRSRWTGPEHASCNRSAGSRLKLRRLREHVDP